MIDIGAIQRLPIEFDSLGPKIRYAVIGWFGFRFNGHFHSSVI
jgi:hypothetical protein